MKIITAEQFMSLDAEVQKVFLGWWEPEMYDYYSSRSGTIRYIYDDLELQAVKEGNPWYIPIFTMESLMDFIKSEFRYILMASSIHDRPTDTGISHEHVTHVKVQMEFYQDFPDLETKNGCTLEALWWVAIRVAMRKLDNKEDID